MSTVFSYSANALLEIVGICLGLHQHCTLTITSMAYYRYKRMNQLDYKHNCVALVDHKRSGQSGILPERSTGQTIYSRACFKDAVAKPLVSGSPPHPVPQ